MGPQCWPFMSYEATGAFIFLSRSKQSESFIFIYYMICFFVVKIYQYKISFLDKFDYYYFFEINDMDGLDSLVLICWTHS